MKWEEQFESSIEKSGGKRRENCKKNVPRLVFRKLPNSLLAHFPQTWHTGLLPLFLRDSFRPLRIPFLLCLAIAGGILEHDLSTFDTTGVDACRIRRLGEGCLNILRYKGFCACYLDALSLDLRINKNERDDGILWLP